jgi:diguanylate cyclase (GGDEF)-like protein
MRLIRLGALVGSLVLLVATTVSLLNQRTQARAEQRSLVTSIALVADQSIAATVERALAVVDVATRDTDPNAMVRSFGDEAAACVTASTTRCTGGDLAATGAYGAGVSASLEQGRPVVVVDDDTASLLVVFRQSDMTSSLLLPEDGLIAPATSAAITDRGGTVQILLAGGSQLAGSGTQRVGPNQRDGRIVVVDTFALPGDSGSVRVVASIPDDATVFGDGFAGYALLFALGTVLAALAGWTFLVDRRTLERRATTDDLTGLPNRREFERLTDEALLAADRFDTGLCVMLIDLNGFKQINDSLGHQVGDHVLRAAAARLSEAVRDGDVVGRWGGDEFVVLLPGIEDGSGVRSAAERIGAQLAANPITGDITVTASIGAALFPLHGTTLDELIRAADEAMYGAKSTGVTHRLADVHRFHPSPEGSGYGGVDRRRSTDRDHHRV